MTNGRAAGRRSTVLVVDDDEAVRTVVAWQLEADGHTVVQADDGVSALNAVRDSPPDLIVLDLTLPGLGGLDVLKALRSNRAPGAAEVPVIVLSGRDGETDRIVGLDLGADDYLVKPFSPGELGARVRSLLRRSSAKAATGSALQHGSLAVDLGARLVTKDGTEVVLTAKEFDLLVFLVAHPGIVYTREQLLNQVWNSASGWVGDATVTEHVHRLRQKLENQPARPEWLRTVRGVGYLWERSA